MTIDEAKEIINFNPRPRKEGDYRSCRSRRNCSNFNPRPRKEGDRPCSRRDVDECYFNPRPRKEGDIIDNRSCAAEDISIHALVKRAT